MNAVLALTLVLACFATGLLGTVAALHGVFAIVIPYTAATLFLGGFALRLAGWAKVPVPFRIPTTCGQQRSLPWLRQARLDNPSTVVGTVGRMALEVLFFRSLLRNTRARLLDRQRLVYGTDIMLWLGALVMHWSLAIILLRHLRLVTDPVPSFILGLESVDGFLQLGIPTWYLTSVFFVAALGYLLARRLVNAQVRYISLFADYFPLLLLLAIGLSGILMRHFVHPDLEAIKEWAVGMATLHPHVPPALSWLFYGHLFLISVLFGYFPFSKLMHLGGIFLSPTRNLTNNSRAVRHINPWDYPVKVHTYDEYEDELREKMVGAGIPVERT